MRESSQADALRAEQGTRLRELGVAASAIPGAFASDPPPPADASVRVLQWNVLAHGLSDDGFIVNTVIVRRRHRAAAAAAPTRPRDRHRTPVPRANPPPVLVRAGRRRRRACVRLRRRAR